MLSIYYLIYIRPTVHPIRSQYQQDHLVCKIVPLIRNITFIIKLKLAIHHNHYILIALISPVWIVINHVVNALVLPKINAISAILLIISNLQEINVIHTVPVGNTWTQ